MTIAQHVKQLRLAEKGMAWQQIPLTAIHTRSECPYAVEASLRDTS
jgi:hypothetical protein